MVRHRRFVDVGLALACIVGSGLPRSAADDGRAPAPAPAPAPADPSDAFFRTTAIPTLRIELAPAALERLRTQPRAYVPCRLREGTGTVYEDVAVKLKGGAGSFRPVDETPAFTLNLDKFHEGQRFHGMEKLHLDNSVQDDTRLDEALCADLFAAAGLAAPRVTHARVTLGDRDLGVYVLKEGVDRLFLARHFEKANGNLYDGGACQDVDADLEKDGGKGPDDRRDLKALVEACAEPDLVARARRLPLVLDIEAFLTFTALERMTCHWDGYSMNTNNYRLYFVPPAGRAIFLPHGMDQMFGEPEASVLDEPVGLVARAVLEVPEWRRGYRARLVSLLPLFDAEKSLLPRARAIDLHLAAAIRSLGPEALTAHVEVVRDLEQRLVARDKSLREQVGRPDPPALEFDAKRQAFVPGWSPVVEDGEPTLEQVDHAGRRAFAIVVPKAGTCVAAWRRGVTLARGRYTLKGNVAVQGVTPRKDAPSVGARLRISGDERGTSLSGSTPWRVVAFDFEVTETLRHVELVAELRAGKGQAYFEVESLRLFRRDP